VSTDSWHLDKKDTQKPGIFKLKLNELQHNPARADELSKAKTRKEKKRKRKKRWLIAHLRY